MGRTDLPRGLVVAAERNVPTTLVRRTRSSVATGVVMARFMEATPALFTRTSSRPWRVRICRNSRLTAGSSATSRQTWV
ncbi:hypothetical protein AQJ64_42650 [Streptomyces griseoruber]|uniref:Uncharacterized protein n=1 Tax=Streptomyces griseoruber TaxID=1943 RepID=A0A101SK59_9ACTN|nr:hypothetical protein AQJ64_42650 [Streptomyces griseoruber]